MFMTHAPGGQGAALSQLVASLGDQLGRRILRHCERAEEPISTRQLAEALDAPHSEVERHVALLVAGEALRAVRVDDASGCFYESALGDRPSWIRKVLESSRRVDERGSDG
jgi:predicted ArsR family transcriptional regulator